jgi:hypothetical protein
MSEMALETANESSAYRNQMASIVRASGIVNDPDTEPRVQAFDPRSSYLR